MPRSPCSTLPDVVAVLHRQRPVEAELVQQPLVARRVHAALARQALDRIAGNQVDQRERSSVTPRNVGTMRRERAGG